MYIIYICMIVRRFLLFAFIVFMSCYLIRFYTHMYMCVICVNNKFLKVYHVAVYDTLAKEILLLHYLWDAWYSYTIVFLLL